jgi:hypothetical protein
MCKSALLFLIIICAAEYSDAAAAQQAGTGGTRDASAAPTMVFPIRPRNEPATSPPVVNPGPAYPPPNIRLRRAYPIHSHPARWK